MTTTAEILTELDDAGIVTITLNRPASLNALTPSMLEQLPVIMREVARDVAVKVVVLRGAGRGFCAGGDLGGSDPARTTDPVAARRLAHPAWNSFEARVERLQQMHQAPLLLHTMGKPTIAMLRGPVAGAGIGLATACDLRIASETLMVTSAFSRLGTSGDFGGSYFVTQLVGPAKAKELYFLSERVPAAECLQLGLVNRVVPDDALERVTMELARQLAEGPPIAYRNIKENINAAEWLSIQQVLDIEARNMTHAHMSEDARAMRKAFVEKLAPGRRVGS